MQLNCPVQLNCSIAQFLALWFCVAPSFVRGESGPTPSTAERLPTNLTFCCAANNDLFQAIFAGHEVPARSATAFDAMERANRDTAVLILADGYPQASTRIDQETLNQSRVKRLRLYIEYPDEFPGYTFGPPQKTQWERGVVAANSPSLGLPKMHLLALHDCQFLPMTAENPLLVLARVAGFDSAVYGLPPDKRPLLFETADGHLVATTKLSNYVSARYAPHADWQMLWENLLDHLDPAGSPHKLTVQPIVRPAYARNDALDDNAEQRAVARSAKWIKSSQLLISDDREQEIGELLRSGVEETSPPPVDAAPGDGSLGILEGYASRILPNGSQLQRTPIRADCQAESAAVLALHALLADDLQSRRAAENLLNYLYFDSELHQGVRGNPQHPAFGLIAWGAISPTWQIGNYGDDNARTLLATMAAAAGLDSSAWDAAMLKALHANLRTTGKLGFRGDRIDVPQLEQQGWKVFHDSERVNYSPVFEAYSWACFLWAYDKTGDREFLNKTKVAIRMTMDAYPQDWRWGDNSERARMLLPLAWLIRIEDTPEHRTWLKQVATDLLKQQQPCGAIPERLGGAGAGHYVVPATNEAYGTTETPLIQRNGDPVSDQLYTTGFALLGLHEAAASTGDRQLKEAENKLAEYVVRIQARSESIPYLDGTWFRAFDYNRWDYWASSADMGWGAWCVESGWGPAWNAVVLALRERNTSLWELTSKSTIDRRSRDVEALMSKNTGVPWP